MLISSMRRRLRTASLGAACGAALAAFAPAAAEAGKLSIGHTVWVGYGPMYLARDLGFYKELGLEVELKVVEDSALSMAAEASGSLSGGATTLDEILKYRSDKFCFKAVVAVDDSAGGDGMVSEEGIATIADLKGKQVALNEGSTSEFWFTYVLKKHGLSHADVTITNMTADEAAAAFIAKRVPAAVTWEPNLTFVKTKNAGKVLIDSKAIPGVIVDVVQFSCKTIAEQPQDVAAFVKGTMKAMAYIKTDQAKAYEIMAKGVGGYLENPKDFADAASGVNFYDLAMNKAYFGSLAKPGPAAETIAVGNEIWGELGKLQMKVTYPEAIDPAFVEAATLD
jgi:NitT/TauT family transport system substrate-binding protein